MRTWLRIATLAFVLSLPGAANAEGIDQLRWLAGCWASERRDPGSGEQWMAPAGGTMLGMSRTVRDGRTVDWEHLRIAEVAPGRLAYIAHPSGQQETTFPLLRSGEHEVVFENLAHDFPHRVSYRLQGDRLLASIEGTDDGQARAIEFPFRRVDCERWGEQVPAAVAPPPAPGAAADAGGSGGG